jgi:hypothetical protein
MKISEYVIAAIKNAEEAQKPPSSAEAVPIFGQNVTFDERGYAVYKPPEENGQKGHLGRLIAKGVYEAQKQSVADYNKTIDAKHANSYSSNTSAPQAQPALAKTVEQIAQEQAAKQLSDEQRMATVNKLAYRRPDMQLQQFQMQNRARQIAPQQFEQQSINQLGLASLANNPNAQQLSYNRAFVRSPAKTLANQGRGGDSMLVHMRPDEVSAMQNMALQNGTTMTVNPTTGLPEAFNLKKMFNFLGKNAQYIVPFVPGAAFESVGLGSIANPVGRGLIGGALGGLSGGRPNLKRGIMSGLASYGLSSAYQGLQAAGGGAGSVPEGAQAPQSEGQAAWQGIKNMTAGDEASRKLATDAFGKNFGTNTAAMTLTGFTGLAAIEEEEKYLEQMRAQNRIGEQEYARRRARIDEAKRIAAETMSKYPGYAVGGEVLMNKAPPDNEHNPYGMKAGGVARMINGDGDGMSDSVPATIDDTQPARLADGEFVIPADVVSGLGNGSTKAGAKQLYAMMDRVRHARTGTKQQGKEINPTKYMPA